MKHWTKESLKEAWLEGLKTHKQTTEKLKYEDSFCALGVLCDVYDPSNWIGDIYTIRCYLPIQKNSMETSLPKDISKIFETSDHFLLTRDYLSREGYSIDIVDANDNGLTFPQISDLIKHFV